MTTMKMQSSKRILLSVAILFLGVSESHAEQQPRLRQRTNMTGEHDDARNDVSNVRDTQQQQQQQATAPTRWLIQYENTEGEAFILQHAAQLHHWFAKEQLVSVDLEENSLVLVRNSPGIKSIEQDHQWKAQGYFERMVEPYELLQNRRFLNSDEIVPYGISMVQADQVTVGDTPITVCIVDTGIELGHPDLDATLVNGADRETEDADGVTVTLRWDNDVRGHGTHVAGTIMARANNGVGVRGMGKIPIFVTRGLDDSGNAFESDIRQAIQQCETAGAKIVSLSLGGEEMSSAMQTLIQRLYQEKDMLIFAAAGNAGEWRMEYPASDPSVISVSAVDENEWYWDKANYGPTIELMAPGVSILSTTVNSSGAFYYAEYSGTSMAVPHASGAAALVWSHHPECTNHQIRFALAASAKDKGESGCDTDFGYGIVQVKNALQFLDAHSCVNATWGAMPMTGNCTVLDLPTNETVKDNKNENNIASLSPSAAPVDSLRSEAPVSFDDPAETTDNADEIMTLSTISPSDSERDAPKESAAPSTGPPAIETPAERTDETEPPVTEDPIDSETEPPNLDDPAPFELPEVAIPENVSPDVTGPLNLPQVDIPPKNTGPLNLPIIPEIPSSNHPFDPESPGVTALDIPPVYAPSEKVQDTDNDDHEDTIDQRDESWSSLPTTAPSFSRNVALLPTPMPSMVPTSRVEEESAEDEEGAEETEDATKDTSDEFDATENETKDTVDGFDAIDKTDPDEQRTKPEATFSAFLSPFDASGQTSPLVPAAHPTRAFFPGKQASSTATTRTRSRKRKRPSRGIWG